MLTGGGVQRCREGSSLHTSLTRVRSKGRALSQRVKKLQKEGDDQGEKFGRFGNVGLEGLGKLEGRIEEAECHSKKWKDCDVGRKKVY